MDIMYTPSLVPRHIGHHLRATYVCGREYYHIRPMATGAKGQVTSPHSPTWIILRGYELMSPVL
jgi:hypothetical protein